MTSRHIHHPDAVLGVLPKSADAPAAVVTLLGPLQATSMGRPPGSSTAADRFSFWFRTLKIVAVKSLSHMLTTEAGWG